MAKNLVYQTSLFVCHELPLQVLEETVPSPFAALRGLPESQMRVLRGSLEFLTKQGTSIGDPNMKSFSAGDPPLSVWFPFRYQLKVGSTILRASPIAGVREYGSGFGNEPEGDPLKMQGMVPGEPAQNSCLGFGLNRFQSAFGCPF